MTPISYLRFSDAGRSALLKMCRDCGYEDPVVLIYGASCPIRGCSLDGVDSSGVSTGSPQEAWRELLPVEFELVVACSPSFDLPKECVVDIDGILVNAPFPPGMLEGTELILDCSDGKFVLLDNQGKDVFAEMMAAVQSQLANLNR
jgi:hypothetical protein